MTLRLYNTLSRKKEAFEPIDASNVRMYVCGPTVYDFAHIGNARPVIVFDVLFRLLRHVYGADHVTYVRNITDVDDKINARAAEEFPDLPLNDAIAKVTSKTTEQFHKDIAALGVLEPTVEPRATDHIDGMKALIETLVEKGHAYVAEGHVVFDVASMPDYGKLANRSLDEMEAGARVEVAPYKKGPMDFVLWKPSKDGEPGWPSPCEIDGVGRPGWHIECSAMSGKHLGDVFDIHGGGIDLTFPHHENEIAQSRCAHGTDAMARYWMHNGFLKVEGEKMSKSLGNFITIHELLETDAWPGNSLRFYMLSTHYRQPINWTASGLRQADDRFYQLESLAFNYVATDVDEEFVRNLCDDLNTPAAFSRLFELEARARDGDLDIGGVLRSSLQFLGFAKEPRESVSVLPISGSAVELLSVMLDLFPLNYPIHLARGRMAMLDSEGWVEEKANAIQLLRRCDELLRVGEVLKFVADLSTVNSLLSERDKARKQKNWAESDRIRDELAAKGIKLKDAKDPETGEIVTTWEVSR